MEYIVFEERQPLGDHKVDEAKPSGNPPQPENPVVDEPQPEKPRAENPVAVITTESTNPFTKKVFPHDAKIVPDATEAMALEKEKSKSPGRGARHRKASQPTGQRYWIHGVPGAKATRPRDDQRNVAELRWSTALRESCGSNWKRHAAFIEAITDDMADAATTAEMHRKGDGLTSILATLRDEAAA